MQLYHAVTRGLYANEICRRVDPKGRGIGQFFHDEIASKHAMELEFKIGLKPEDRPLPKVMHIERPPVILLLKYVLQYLLPLSYPQRLSLIGFGSSHDVLLDFEVSSIREMVSRLLRLDHGLNSVLLKSTTCIKGLKDITDINQARVLELTLASANGVASAR